MAITNPNKFNVRIKNKYDSYENWIASGLVLEAGEIAIAYTTVNVKVDNGTAKHPALLMKVGDGEKTFANLPWLSAKAADVLSVCKNEDDLKQFVNGVIADAGIASDESMEALAGRVTVVENDLNTETTGLKARVTTAEQAIDALEALVGDKEVSVQIEEAIAALKLDETYDKKDSAKAVQDNLDAFELIVNEAIGTADSEGSILTAAKTHANSLDTAMNTRVEALEAKLGEDEKTVATQISEAVAAEATARDTAIETAINTEVSNRNTAITNAIDAEVTARNTAIADAVKVEKERAEGKEAELAASIKTISDDYLKTADKTELQGNIDTVSNKVTTLIGEDANKSVRTIANEELAKQLIAEGAAESLDTLQEIAAWIQDHPDDAAAMNQAIKDLEALVGTLPEEVTATTVVGLVQELVKAEEDRAKGIETGLDNRLKAVEASVGETGSVATAISTAKQEAIDAAAANAATKVSELTNGAVKDNADAIAVLNGNAETEGSVAKAVADAEARAAQDAQNKVDALTNGQVKTNKEAIEAINNAETGILAQAKKHVTDEIAKLDAEVEVSSDKHVVTGVTEVDGKLTAVKEVELKNIAFTGSTDDLIQGTMTLVFDCGNATA